MVLNEDVIAARLNLKSPPIMEVDCDDFVAYVLSALFSSGFPTPPHLAAS